MIQCTDFSPQSMIGTPVVNCPGQATEETRPADDVIETMKGLQERTQLIEWDDGEALH